MLKTSALLTALLLSTGLSTVPVLADSNGVPTCVQPRTDRAQREALETLSDRLQLSTKQSGTIEYWNGCLKVSYTDGGHWVTDFYDPDSFRQLGTLN